MKPSWIESLSVENFRQFDKLSIQFSKGFNFIAGPNGSGKTSILACIAHCFTSSWLEYSRASKDCEFFVDVNHKGALFRIGHGKGSIESKGYRATQRKMLAKMPQSSGRENLNPNNLEDKVSELAPLFMGAQRSISYVRMQGMEREAALVERRRNQRNQSVKLIFEEAKSDVKRWLINRYFMVDKDWAKTEKKNWNHFILALPALGPFDSDFKFVKIEADMEPVFSIYGKECYLEELSAGFQAVLTIVAKIIGWIEGIGENVSAEIENAIGTVLIDEIDVHLHPEWQFTLRNGLERLFPNIQFIVTTHSPHVLASAKVGEVLVMPTSHDSDIRVHASTTAYSGWTTDQILSEVMGVKSLDNKLYERLIHEGFDFVEHKNFEGLKSLIERLRSIAHPDDAIVKVLEVRLASLALYNND